jgi:hypothetical protein
MASLAFLLILVASWLIIRIFTSAPKSSYFQLFDAEIRQVCFDILMAQIIYPVELIFEVVFITCEIHQF